MRDNQIFYIAMLPLYSFTQLSVIFVFTVTIYMYSLAWLVFSVVWLCTPRYWMWSAVWGVFEHTAVCLMLDFIPVCLIICLHCSSWVILLNDSSIDVYEYHFILLMYADLSSQWCNLWLRCLILQLRYAICAMAFVYFFRCWWFWVLLHNSVLF